jgi:hypothetical protein
MTTRPAPTCDDCFEELAAEHACQTCHLRFCPAHAAEHRRRKSTRAHDLVALAQAPEALAPEAQAPEAPEAQAPEAQAPEAQAPEAAQAAQ